MRDALDFLECKPTVAQKQNSAKKSRSSSEDEDVTGLME